MLLEANNIHKQYAGHKALDDVSISIPENQVFGLLGPNGAGKTTMIRIINQITAPDSGTLLFKGKPLERAHIAQIGYLPEERGLYKKMKVGEQCVYLAQLKGLSKREAIKRLHFWFEKMEVMPWWNKKVSELSKGMAQKVQFITTVLHEPELLIFDEPFSGFDPINTNLIKSEILNLKENGATIIFSAHNMASVEEVCDNIALINKSQKILSGNIREIKESFRSNLFEVQHTGNLTAHENYSIESSITENERTTSRVKFLKEDQNELLRILMEQVKIISFNEVLPNMNDIFIRVVEEANNL